jgi:hypothetical protein
MRASTDRAEAYWRAADEVATTMFIPGEHKACCTAIIDTAPPDIEKELLSGLATYFRPDDIKPGEYWFGEPTGSDARKVRILALCFMAAMVEAGDA